MSETTLLKLQNIIKKYTEVDLSKINLDTSLEEIGITSLKITDFKISCIFEQIDIWA